MTDKDLTPETEQPADAGSDQPPTPLPPDAETPLSADVLPVADVTPLEAEAEEFESAPVYASATPEPEPTASDDWMPGDIDAALAAVATLSEIMPQREAEAEARADARHSAPAFVPAMRLPPLMTLKRGHLGSMVPALLLIALGAWLTLTTTGGAPPEPQLVAAVVLGGIVVSLLAQWLGSGGWSRGVLFFALLILFLAGVIVFSVQPNGIDLARGYPLLLVALGLAVALSGVLARPLNAKLLAPGALLVLAGGVALGVTLDFIPGTLVAAFVPFAPVVLGVVLILWLLPLVFRRR